MEVLGAHHRGVGSVGAVNHRFVRSIENGDIAALGCGGGPEEDTVPVLSNFVGLVRFQAELVNPDAQIYFRLGKEV